MEKLLKSACKSPSRKTQYALTTEKGSRLFKISEHLLSNTNAFKKHFNETKSLYVFYILKLWMRFPLKGIWKTLLSKNVGQKESQRDKSREDVQGQRGSKVPYFLHQEIIVTLLTWNMGFGYSHSRGSGGYLVCSIKGEGLFWEQDNICHNSLHFSLYFPHSFPHWSWNPKC